MSYRPLELTLISAKDLNKVTLFSKMEVYAVAMVSGDPRSKKKTQVDKDGGRNPNWNKTFSFNVMEYDLDRCVLHVVLKAERVFGDREIGEVHVPVRELLDGWNQASLGSGDGEKKPVPSSSQFLSYQVRKPSGKAKGALNLSYKFRDLVTVAAPPPPQIPGPYPNQDAKSSGKAEPVTAYPAASGPSGSYAYPPPAQPGYGYDAPPFQDGYGYPAPAGYPPQPGHGYPPQQPEYGYPPPQQPGYGYPPPQQGIYGYPPQQGGYYPPPQQPKKSKFGGAGMGLGAGLLGGAIGGMILGDMVSDASGFDGGFDF